MAAAAVVVVEVEIKMSGVHAIQCKQLTDIGNNEMISAKHSYHYS